jgi:hypothetical protein
MLPETLRGDEQTVHSRKQASGMPTILRDGRWRFFFYSNEGSEPPHVHVESSDGGAKFWLTPVALVVSSRLRSRELRELEWFIRLNRKVLLEAWNDFFGR